MKFIATIASLSAVYASFEDIKNNLNTEVEALQNDSNVPDGDFRAIVA